MAQGKNKEYMRNPQVFLMNHNIVSPGIVVPGAAAAGAYGAAPILSPGPSNIDLVPLAPGMVQIQNYNNRPHGFGARPIRAYWLPAAPGVTNTITLGNAANYFFTPYLSGCLFAAYNNAALQLIVEHTNATGAPGLIAARLGIIQGMLANGAIRVLTPTPWPAALGAVPAAPHSVVHYPVYACVIGGRLAGGWRFRYKLIGAPGILVGPTYIL